MAAKFVKNRPFQFRNHGKPHEGNGDKGRRFVKEEEGYYYWNTSLDENGKFEKGSEGEGKKDGD
jgi:hypothetical protein